jgi:hypothetical protein
VLICVGNISCRLDLIVVACPREGYRHARSTWYGSVSIVADQADSSTTVGAGQPMTAKDITIVTMLFLPCFWLGGLCHAQTAFPGDFLPGLASGTDDTWGIAAGDFNRDGKQDLATVSLNGNTLNVFLGNGDGTFTGGFSYTFTQQFSPMSVIAADVNGDGKLDLIVASYNTLNLTGTPISVFFGNGDGTFQHEADYEVNNHSTAVVAADFNGDGALDLAATVNDAGTVAILLNNGDGTFQAPVSYAASNGPYSLAVGDFNGDGNADLAVTNCEVVPNGNPINCGAGNGSGTVSVLLGNGDGTFQTATSYTAGVTPYAIAAAALRSGGNIDLLVTDISNGSLLVLPGKGDGTFQSPVSYPGDGGTYLTVADFNGDGKLDALVSGLSLVEFLGNGDGTLQPAVDYYRPTPGHPYWWQAAADFNGDGHEDVAVSSEVFLAFLNAAGTSRQATTTSVQTVYNGCGSVTVNATVTSGGQAPTGALTLQVDGQYFTPVQFGSLVSGKASAGISLNPGTHTITAVYAGDGLTQGSGSAPSSVNIQPQSSSTTLTSSQNPSTVGQLVSFTAVVTPSGTSINCLSLGTVTFLDGTTVLGTAPGPGEAVFSTNALTAGNHSITASFGGTSYISPSISPILVEVVDTPSLVVFTPTTLAFPNTQVGQNSSAQTVTLANAGEAALSINNMSASGAFSETNNCGTTVAGGQKCTINAIFSPTQTGALAGTITVNDNAPGGQQSVLLTGTGVSPTVMLSPSSLTFSNQAVGTSSTAQTVMVQNSGNGALTISSFAITGTGSSAFAQTNNCGGSVAAGGSCQIRVIFTPPSAATFQAAISIFGNVPGGSQTIPLSGSTPSAPVVSLSPPSISFPNQYVNTSGLPVTVTLANTGNATLTIGGVNTSVADFGVLSNCGNSVAAGASCSIGVFFDPTAAGSRSGALMITDNAAGSPQSVRLTGLGQGFSVAPGSQTTASIAPGQTANYMVSIAPGGGFEQTVTLSCSGAPAQSTCSISPSSVTLSGASAATANVTVTTAGNSARLTLPHSDPPPGRPFGSWFALSGTLRLAMLVSFAAYRRERRRRLLYGLAFLSLLAIASTITACGGGTSQGTGGTPAGTYNVTVSGTFTAGATNLTQTTKFTLIVQ